MKKLYRSFRLSVLKMLRVLLAKRILALILICASFLLIFGAWLKLPLWECPFYAVTNLPCPGCGMTRSFVALVQGKVGQSFYLHPFSLYVLFIGTTLFISAILPARKHKNFSKSVLKLEKKIPIHTLMLLSFVAFGLGRVIYLILERV